MSPTYDSNGNTTGDAAGHSAIVYDAWDRLTLSCGPTTQTYTYDALGRRISHQNSADFNPPTGLYYSANWQVLEERKCESRATAQYVWGISFVDELVVADKDIDVNAGTGTANNGAGSYTSGMEKRLYVQQDANFNVTSLADTSGNVVERYAYDPYGAVTVLHGATDADGGVTEWATDTGGSDWNWVYLHQGGRYDKEADLYYFRKRDYSSALGRWMQQDPTRYNDGMSLYQALRSAPVSMLDPAGLAAAQAKVQVSADIAVSYSAWRRNRYESMSSADGFRYDPPARNRTMWSLGIKVSGQTKQEGKRTFFVGNVQALPKDLTGLQDPKHVEALISNLQGQPLWKKANDGALSVVKAGQSFPDDNAGMCVECRMFKAHVDFTKEDNDKTQTIVDLGFSIAGSLIPGESLLGKVAGGLLGEGGSLFGFAANENNKKMLHFVVIVCADDKAFVGAYNLPKGQSGVNATRPIGDLFTNPGGRGYAWEHGIEISSNPASKAATNMYSHVGQSYVEAER